MQPNKKFDLIQSSLKKSSFEVWLGITVITTMLLLIIANGLNIAVNLKRIIFYFCLFLWGLTGLSLVFKDELKLGPLVLKGKIVPIFGIAILLYFWVKIILYCLG